MMVKNLFIYICLFMIFPIIFSIGDTFAEDPIDLSALPPGYIVQNYASTNNWMDPRAFMPAVPGEVLVKLQTSKYLTENSNKLKLFREALTHGSILIL